MTGPELLKAAAPDWAACLGDGPAATDWISAPTLPSGAPVPAFVIRVAIDGGLLFAAERDPGTRLPRWCPELHVNPDASFCLGRRLYGADDPADVAAFWQALGEFLVAQHHVARRGRWPAGRWLSHGEDAADRQDDAETGAAAAGFAREYASCLEFDEGWFAEQARSGRPRVARDAPCPRDCRDDRGRVVRFAHCRHRGALQRVVAAERARRAAQDRYFAAARRSGRTCCRRVEGCPLAGRMAA